MIYFLSFGTHRFGFRLRELKDVYWSQELISQMNSLPYKDLLNDYDPEGRVQEAKWTLEEIMSCFLWHGIQFNSRKFWFN